jgi:hypothetical protein
MGVAEIAVRLHFLIGLSKILPPIHVLSDTISQI